MNTPKPALETLARTCCPKSLHSVPDPARFRSPWWTWDLGYLQKDRDVFISLAEPLQPSWLRYDMTDMRLRLPSGRSGIAKALKDVLGPLVMSTQRE